MYLVKKSTNMHFLNHRNQIKGGPVSILVFLVDISFITDLLMQHMLGCVNLIIRSWNMKLNQTTPTYLRCICVCVLCVRASLKIDP